MEVVHIKRPRNVRRKNRRGYAYNYEDISVEVLDKRCKNRDCFVPLYLLPQEKWICYTRDKQGCPGRISNVCKGKKITRRSERL